MKLAHAGPFVVGSLAVLGLAVALTIEDPNPGALASAHARLPRLAHLAGCETCHAEQGMTAGCLSCHAEIDSQLRAHVGYHSHLIGDGDPECARCHPEHNGSTFSLMGEVAWGADRRREFDHGHVEFALDGAHVELSCAECHQPEGAEPFTLPEFADHPRSRTYLNLSQGCVDCHKDVHDGTTSTECTQCHDQEVFRPAVGFDHAEFLLLEGGHASVACKACHLVPEQPEKTSEPGLVFYDVCGTACHDCHADPHRTDWAKECLACHAAHAPPWSDGAAAITPEVHAGVAFRLDAPHHEVACEACHPAGSSYGERYPDPSTDGYLRGQESCHGCHADVHRGQFAGLGEGCLSCHERTRFAPPSYGRADHDGFMLRGAHVETDCNACHEVDAVLDARRFVGTARDCKGCHEDVHDGQFDAALQSDDCDSCHGEDAFLPSRYDIARHDSFPLTGGHRAVACTACHERDPAGVRRFVETARRCVECHADRHGSQFVEEIKQAGCVGCHREDATSFAIRPFDHRERAGYALIGGHRTVACAECHREERVKGPDGDPVSVRRYRGTSDACASCHTDVHRGQFAQAGRTRCEQCHASTGDWARTEFDHGRSRFPLDKTHRSVGCSECHPSVRQPDGASVVQYRPLGTECRDCHDFKTR